MAKVLVVDDDRTMTSLLSTLLGLEGYDVVQAVPGEGVLETVQREHPELVLMDVFLTGADGIELLKQLKSHPDLAHIPVVMSSGMDVSDRCLEEGAEAFLPKPYNPDTLCETIRKNIGVRSEPGRGGK
jgi:CheY-like chemotaxis protein